MFKLLLTVLVVSLAAAACEIHRCGTYAGLAVGILLFPGFIALQWMLARFLLRRKPGEGGSV